MTDRESFSTAPTETRHRGTRFWRAFLDWFTLFSGVSTASNLSRTRETPVRGRGLFLFRTAKKPDAGSAGR